MQPVMPRTTSVPPPLYCASMLARREHALLGLLAHGAGVDQDEIGAGRIVGARVPAAIEQPQHQVGVRDIHLAAVGFDVNRGHRAFL